MNRFSLSFALIVFLCCNVAAQQTDGIIINGIILDEQIEPIIGAFVEVTQNNTTIAGAVTDEDGKYSITIPISNSTPDTLVLTINYFSYKAERITLLKPFLNTWRTIQLTVDPLQQDKLISLGPCAVLSDTLYLVTGKQNTIKRTWYWLTRWTH